jgi:hypothetical protein
MSVRPGKRCALLLVAIGAAFGCGRGDGEPDAAVQDIARALAAPLPAEPGALAIVRAEPVHGRTGPGEQPFEVSVRTASRDGGHPRRFGARTFDTAYRRALLDAYPCTSCHIDGRPAIAGGERVEDAHGNIQPVHPAEVGATCTTCHSPARVDRLNIAVGESATLDHPYRLCAQCHVLQVDAWAAGAHGKRLDGWHGRRVVMNCTDCHDPHRPAIEQRIPFPGPRLP